MDAAKRRELPRTSPFGISSFTPLACGLLRRTMQTRAMAMEPMTSEWWVEWRQGRDICRLPVRGRLSIGRSRECDVVLDDPYVSRVHCTLQIEDGHALLDARTALNLIRVRGTDVAAASLDSGDLCMVGNTTLRVVGAEAADTQETLRLAGRPSAPMLLLRASTRELVDPEGTLVAQFSTAEFLAFQKLAQRHPDAANHQELGAAVWGGLGFDQYQLHRLMQRLRQRLGESGGILENVRGAGYRLRLNVEAR